MAEHSNHKFKPALNTNTVTVPGRLQLHTKAGRESYLSRIKVWQLTLSAEGKQRSTAQPEHTRACTGLHCITLQEAESDIAQAVEERRTQQERDELAECTFKPEVRSLLNTSLVRAHDAPPTARRMDLRRLRCAQIRDAPQYVKRIANSMKLTRAAKPPPEKTTYSFLSTREH
jgi:hypothetical protein